MGWRNMRLLKKKRKKKKSLTKRVPSKRGDATSVSVCVVIAAEGWRSVEEDDEDDEKGVSFQACRRMMGLNLRGTETKSSNDR